MQPRDEILISCLVSIYLVTLCYVSPISQSKVLPSCLLSKYVCFCLSILAIIHMLLSFVVIIPITTFSLVSQFAPSPFFKPTLHHHGKDLSRIQIWSLVTRLWLKVFSDSVTFERTSKPMMCSTRSSSWFNPFLTFKSSSCCTPESWLRCLNL